MNFEIKPDRSWTLSKCGSSTGSGAITTEEYDGLNSLITNSVSSTRSQTCEDILKMDSDYIELVAENNTLSRTFDPEDKCYSGDETKVQELRKFLRVLRRRYTN